ncbi:hypothetical protein RI367_007654, partial [Sorochytrium milnesiophthora]
SMAPAAHGEAVAVRLTTDASVHRAFLSEVVAYCGSAAEFSRVDGVECASTACKSPTTIDSGRTIKITGLVFAVKEAMLTAHAWRSEPVDKVYTHGKDGH